MRKKYKNDEYISLSLQKKQKNLQSLSLSPRYDFLTKKQEAEILTLGHL
jgi:hypothetical protein